MLTQHSEIVRMHMCISVCCIAVCCKCVDFHSAIGFVWMCLKSQAWQCFDVYVASERVRALVGLEGGFQKIGDKVCRVLSCREDEREVARKLQDNFIKPKIHIIATTFPGDSNFLEIVFSYLRLCHIIVMILQSDLKWGGVLLKTRRFAVREGLSPLGQGVVFQKSTIIIIS